LVIKTKRSRFVFNVARTLEPGAETQERPQGIMRCGRSLSRAQKSLNRLSDISVNAANLSALGSQKADREIRHKNDPPDH
jgi:hypothetical protein